MSNGSPLSGDSFIPTETNNILNATVSSFVKLDLENCYKDGPPFQAHLIANEHFIHTVESLLKSFARTSRQSNESFDSVSRANVAVAEALESIGRFEAKFGEDPKGIIVQTCERFKAIESDRKDMTKNIENYINVPLETYFKSDFIQLKELRRRYEKAKIEFGYGYSRYMSKKQKDFSLIESATEVAALRRELHDSSLSLSIHLNEMADKKTTLLYSSSLNYLNYRLEFAEKEVERLKSIKQHVEELAIKNVTTDEELKDRLINAFDRKNEMISKATPFYNPLHPSSNIDCNAAESSDRSGYLYKRSSHALRPVWSRRFFSLNGDKLIYYSMEGKGDQARVGIDLRLCHVQAVDDPERRYCFDLISPIRGYRLQAENEASLLGWLEAIKAGTVLALQRNIMFNNGKESSSALSKEFGLLKGNGHEELIQSILSINSIELSLSEEKRKEIMRVPGNSVCADCQSKDPDWASLSFGILICIKCSGIHRSLGVHLSKVRSLSLDFWTPEHFELMKSLGNQRSWEIFEEKLNDVDNSETTDSATNNITAVKPDPSSSQIIKENWIFSKYVVRDFVKFTPLEDYAEDSSEGIRSLMWDSIEKGDVVNCLRALALGALVDDNSEEITTEDSLAPEEEAKSVLVQNALQRSAQLGHWQVLALLLLWGANVEAVDSIGRNLVHYLAEHDQPSVSVLLSVLRKNPGLGGVEDSNGRTPLQYAEDCENGPVATIIRIFRTQMEKRSIAETLPSGQETPTSDSNQNDGISNNNTNKKKHLASVIGKMLHFNKPFRRRKH